MKRLIALLFLASLAGWTSAAHAYESPQHFAFEVKFGPYGPALDQTAGLNGATPYSNLMGDPSDPYGSAPSRALLSQFEFDYQFLNKFGSLGVGISGGYYRRSALAFINLAAAGQPEVYCSVSDDGMGNRAYKNPSTGSGMTYDTCTSQGEENILNVVPLAILAVYRFDVLDKRFRVPIIPYIKAGLGYYIWWFGKTGSIVADVKTNDGNGGQVSVHSSGATAGLVLNPGLAIDLSTLDPAAARVMDREMGLNRVSAFIELNAAFMSGWGASNKLNLSDTTFSAGLAFEF